jgi:hypothetical protein
LSSDADIHHLVTERIQRLASVDDIFTIITFKAFGSRIFNVWYISSVHSISREASGWHACLKGNIREPGQT